MTYFIAKRQLFESRGAFKVSKNCDFGPKYIIFSNFRGENGKYPLSNERLIQAYHEDELLKKL